MRSPSALRALGGLLPRIAGTIHPKAAPVTSRLAGSQASVAVRSAVHSAPATLTLARHKAQPAAAWIARLTVTATFAYLLAGLMPAGQRSVLAPLTALIVVQVTMFQTIRSALQRVVSVVAGVLVALAFSAFLGFTWWSLAILIAAGLAIGSALHLGN
ncbi:MAG: aromatic acid exporter family protein, partial [Streptosporangiaceae bacterium]